MADDESGALEVESAESEPSLADDLRSEFQAAEPEGASDEDASPSAEAKEPSAEESGEPEEAESEEPSDGGDEESVPLEEAAELIQPPDHWSAEHKSAFNELDASGREFFMDRHRSMEGELTRRSQELASVKKAFEPHRQEMELNGLSMEQAVTRLLAAHKYLQDDPKSAISYLANQYGVDFAPQAADEEDTFSEDEDFDTDTRLIKRLDALEKKMDSSKEESRQLRVADQTNAAAQQLRQFAEATDESGNKVRPHFEAVQGAMTTLAHAWNAEGKPYTYDDLYEQAVWMVPGVREKMMSGKPADSEDARREKVIRAKRASAGARGVSKSPASRSADDVPEDLGEHLKKEFALAAEMNE